VECIVITEHYNFNVGNAIKYLWRAGLKDGVDPIEDLKKAAWYVNREIERLGLRGRAPAHDRAAVSQPEDSGHGGGHRADGAASSEAVPGMPNLGH
jgi:hypothetical protein